MMPARVPDTMPVSASMRKPRSPFPPARLIRNVDMPDSPGVRAHSSGKAAQDRIGARVGASGDVHGSMHGMEALMACAPDSGAWAIGGDGMHAGTCGFDPVGDRGELGGKAGEARGGGGNVRVVAEMMLVVG